MSKFDQQTMTAICDSLASSPSFRLAAARVGISEASLFSWASQSRKGTRPELVLNEWMGERNIPFHVALGTARKVSLHSVVSEMESRGLNGHYEPVYFQGRPMWREAEDLVGVDDETLTLLGLVDRYERDANGNRIQLTTHIQPPVALVLAIASANFPGVYGDKKSISITSKSTVGVHIAKADYSKPMIAPRPVEVIADQRVVDEAIYEAIEEETADLDEDQNPVADEIDDAPAPAQPPRNTSPRGEAIPAPVSGPNPAVRRTGLSEMERDLLARLSAKPGSSARSAPVGAALRDSDDYSEDHVGAGPTPTGTKIA